MSRFLVCLWVGLSLDRATQAQTSREIEFEADLTFRQVLANCWTPVHVTVTNRGTEARELEVWTGFGRNPDAPDFQAYQPLSIAPGDTKQVTLYVIPRPWGLMGSVWLRENGRRLDKPKRITVNQAAEGKVMLVVSRKPGRFAALTQITFEAYGMYGNQGPTPIILADCPAQLPPDWLPDRWIGYQVFDFVLLHDAAVDEWRPAQRQALLDWVHLGGSVGVSMGEDWHWYLNPYIQELLGSRAIEPARGPPWGWRDSEGKLSATSYFIDAPFFAPRYGSPSVSVRTLGDGRVWFLGFDTADAAYRRSEGITAAWLNLFRSILQETPDSRPRSLRRGGDFQEERRDPQRAQFLSISTLPSLLLIFGLILAYVTLVGPVNYFVLSHYRLHPYFLYTVPAISLAFVAVIFAGGYVTHGMATLSREITLVRPLQGTERLHAVKYIALRPSSAKTFAIELDERSTAYPFHPDEKSLEAKPVVIRQGANFRLEDFRLEIWETGFVRVESVLDGPCRVRVEGGGSGLEVANDGPWAFSRAAVLRDQTLWAADGEVLPRGRVSMRRLDEGQPGSPLERLQEALGSSKTTPAGQLLGQQCPASRVLLVARLEDDPVTVRMNRWTMAQEKAAFLISGSPAGGGDHD
ncbi:MAG: hypothetical protein HYU36_13240 [Planctomycetes bacterium]|nr:hypothetical protein [Planctomycetota bacterium]